MDPRFQGEPEKVYPPPDIDPRFRQPGPPPPHGMQPQPHAQPRPYYPAKTAKDLKQERLQLIKYFLFAYNLVIFLCGSVLLGIGIWMAVDRSFMTYIIGNDLYAAAIYLILAGGGIIFLISFLGCCGAITENKCMLVTFMGFLVFIFIVLFIGGILAIVFKAQITDAVKDTMTSTLTDTYGIDFHNDFNRYVTDAWDKAQERLACCGVTYGGWEVYKSSKWYEQYGATYEQRGTQYGHEDQKPYVPQSCCIKDRFWRYVNLDVCQKWRLGPPGSPVDGAINRALYYEGCYTAGVRYLEENAAILIGLGITIAALLIVGIILSLLLVRRL